MTKYILNSGGIRNNLPKKKEFHQEIVRDLGPEPSILLCNFAQPREDWEVKYPGYINSILEDMPESICPKFTMALPSNFSEQCSHADAIYFHGGDDNLLMHWVRLFDLVKLFKDKVVATNSASSNMLARHSWTCDWRECIDGLGILPIKFIPHYQSNFGSDDPRGSINWGNAYAELSEYGDKTLPIHALREGEYIIIQA